MLIQLALVHPCGETIVWTAGQYFNRRSRVDSRRRRPIHQCPKCREALGSAFVRAEEVHPPGRAAQPRLHLQAS